MPLFMVSTIIVLGSIGYFILGNGNVPTVLVDHSRDKPLADSGIRQRTNLLVVGVRDSRRARIEYNPGPGFELGEGMTLIVLGPRESISDLRKMTGTPA